ncbi:MAG: hypothetical protein P4L84_03345 [Isosphaeraceae bacterium]|nr:hypothetical protein [Isosphaeraceae bacterium]
MGEPPIVFNFAIVGSGPELAHLNLQRLLAERIQPDLVIIEFWPPFWCVNREFKEFSHQTNVGLLSFGESQLLKNYLEDPAPLYRTWATAQFFPLVTNRLSILDWFAPQWVLPPVAPSHYTEHLDGMGWWSPTISVQPQERLQLIDRYRKIYAPRLIDYRIATMPDRALRNILALCHRDKIRAVVVFLPEGTGFRTIYPPATLAVIEDYLKRVGNDAQVPIVDARSWVSDDQFIDGHHLLPEGAESFTRRLGEEVVKPLLQNSSVGL